MGRESWPETLQVYPSHPGDPVKLVRILKDGKELVPGTYRMPQIAGDAGQTVDAVKGWLDAASFTLKSQTSKNIVSIGISVVFPTRNTDLECGEPPRGEWCGANPHWCDGGCPTLTHDALHWGLIPGKTASGLEARYAQLRDDGENWRIVRQGNGTLRIAPGEEITLSQDGRDAAIWCLSDPGHGVYDVMNGIMSNEGIDEAKDLEPCAERANSKTGCALTEVAKFNVGIDIVYFEDGTIWGNYGYGYALPNPDGIFTRVDARDFPGIARPTSAPN